jgi:hypothetical protein
LRTNSFCVSKFSRIFSHPLQNIQDLQLNSSIYSSWVTPEDHPSYARYNTHFWLADEYRRDITTDRVANNQILAKTGKVLGDIQACILEQALQGSKLKDIRVIGYADSTIQRVFCPELWELLSNATGQKVRVNTVQLVLQKLLKESNPDSLKKEDSSSAFLAPPLSLHLLHSF